MNRPGEHYAMFYKYPDGWGQFAIMGPIDAERSVVHAKGKVCAIDMVLNEVRTFGHLLDDMDES